MRKKCFLLSTITALSLSSCIVANDKTFTKEVPLYDIDLTADIGEDEIAPLDGYNVGTISPLFIENQEYVPYLSLEQYASLYEQHLADNARSVFTNEGAVAKWEIYVDDQLYFYTGISYFERLAIKIGDISNAFSSDDDPTDVKALTFAVNNLAETINVKENNFETYSFSNIQVKIVSKENVYYFPLGFLDLTYSESSSIYHHYNYFGIYETRDVENFATKEFLVNDVSYTVDTQMSLFRSELLMPEYLINYNANMFLYTMDNFYGLKDYKGITSFKAFLKQYDMYDDLFSKDGYIRGCAYHTALRLLDDGHTAIISINDTWDEENSGPYSYGSHTINRSEEYQELLEVREAQELNSDFIEENGVRYSDSGETALIIFDKFSFGKEEEVFEEDDTIKEDADKYDTYIRLVEAFNDIVDKNTVNNVVLDVSLNGGGVLGVMMKLLALISNNNQSEVHMYNESAGYVAKYSSSIDSNFDAVFNNDDSFGGLFNFYVATSLVSFSAANAFAFYADLSDTATIIGHQSGGGECAVSIHYLPNSQYVYHSSSLHLGYYNEEENQFYGDEEGVEPEIYFNDFNIYGDPNAIEEIIG